MERKTDVCEEFYFDPEAVSIVKKRMLGDNLVTLMSETFKILGDRTRINILQALMQKELCVCDLSAALEMSSSAVSHQLRVLRNCRLVKYRKEGKNVYYSIDDEHISMLFEQALEHVKHG